jgi:hypothetical protein
MEMVSDQTTPIREIRAIRGKILAEMSDSGGLQSSTASRNPKGISRKRAQRSQRKTTQAIVAELLALQSVRIIHLRDGLAMNGTGIDNAMTQRRSAASRNQSAESELRICH